MCTPTILIGMAIGGGIGYATTGSVKGAVIGAALGGFGGYAVGAAGGVASGAGGALLGPPASATASGGFFSTLTSPGASLGFQAVGFGVNMIGQLQAGDARATEFAYRRRHSRTSRSC